jgi:AcrR family transcriptional regulator
MNLQIVRQKTICKTNVRAIYSDVSSPPHAASQKAPRSQRAEGGDPSKGQTTRKRILDRALELAGTRGLDGLTIGELASDLELSKSGLFAHFKSKERLQLEILEVAADHFAQHVLVPALAQPRGIARLEAIFANWLEWIRSNQPMGGCIFIAGAMEWDDREGPVREALVHWFEELYGMLERAVRLCVDTGDFRSDLDVKALAYDLHAVAMKFHLDVRLLRSPIAAERARSAFDRLLSQAKK